MFFQNEPAVTDPGNNALTPTIAIGGYFEAIMLSVVNATLFQRSWSKVKGDLRYCDAECAELLGARYDRSALH